MDFHKNSLSNNKFVFISFSDRKKKRLKTGPPNNSYTFRPTVNAVCNTYQFIRKKRKNKNKAKTHNVKLLKIDDVYDDSYKTHNNKAKSTKYQNSNFWLNLLKQNQINKGENISPVYDNVYAL